MGGLGGGGSGPSNIFGGGAWPPQYFDVRHSYVANSYSHIHYAFKNHMLKWPYDLQAANPMLHEDLKILPSGLPTTKP